ncbi:MAG: DUF4159 domain-containing protein [Thermoguttaceae bacterium]|jgi:hypothetical protein|nr:DUF4159 domain-containing protein [Thermoguttaceae bacterium]
MKRLLTAAFACAVSIVAIAPTAQADITAEEVRHAIERGVAYLKREQHADGRWPDWPGKEGGVTSLCTLALLSAGVPPEDDSVQRALGWLRVRRLKDTYTVALQTMAFCLAEPEKDRLRIEQNVRFLEVAQVADGAFRGTWGYSTGSSRGDNSNTQFALLALHEAERAGIEVNRRTWMLAKAHWENTQNEDGSWGYTPGDRGYGSMTAAGIGSLVIVSDKIFEADATVEGDRILCCGQRGRDDSAVERGIEWMGRNFAVTQNPGKNVWYYYYLYAMERVGRLTARRFFYNPRTAESYDWYREGAAALLRNRDSLQDFWRGQPPAENDPHIATSLALLFLSKGRLPILMAKLKHSSEGDWNRHRSDVNNLTRYVESRWRRDLTWQTIDLGNASVEDLLEAPVVYLCGSAAPLPGGDQARTQLAEKLRDYLDRGGFLVAEGYCGEGFDDGFRDLMTRVFPEPEYRLRLLDPGHPIWHAEEKVRVPRRLEGIDFGCRTSVIFAPRDPAENPRPSLSCLWELSRPGRGTQYAASVQQQIDDSLALGVNILAYATNRELKYKDPARPEENDARPRDGITRGRVAVAKLEHPGGCNAAPRALVNLMEAATAKLGLRAGAEQVMLRITDSAMFDHHLVFMHGRHTFRLTDQERQQLKTYLERGGMMMADSICGNRAFVESFRREMALIFPDKPLEPIPASDPLLTTAYGGFDLRQVTRRDPQARDDRGPLEAVLRKVPPELEGIRFDDRWGVVFSPYDISCALELRDSLECRGYLREDAARIGLNVILYSLQQ